MDAGRVRRRDAIFGEQFHDGLSQKPAGARYECYIVCHALDLLRHARNIERADMRKRL